MLESLKEEVFQANLELKRQNVVIYTRGNVSGITEDRKNIVIKPSEIAAAQMKEEELKLDPLAVPGIIVKNHGPFAYGNSPAKAVENAVVLEKAAEMAFRTLLLNPNASMEQYILDKHYFRKHGKNAYYGQKSQ